MNQLPETSVAPSSTDQSAPPSSPLTRRELTERPCNAPGCRTQTKRVFCRHCWNKIPSRLKSDFLGAANSSPEKKAVLREILRWFRGEPAAPAANAASGPPSRPVDDSTSVPSASSCSENLKLL